MKQLKPYFLQVALFFFISMSLSAQSVDLVATVDVTPPLSNGQTFNYSILSTGNPYNALRIKLIYNPSVIQLNGLTPVYAFDFTPVNNTGTPGLVKYEAASLSGNITTDEIIFTIEFEVLDETQAISIAHNYDAADGTVVINSSGSDILGTANDILLETLSVETFNNSTAIFIYPNPAQDTVTIKLTNNQTAIESLTIQSLDGKTVLLKQMDSSSTTPEGIVIDTSALPSSLYFLTVKTIDGNQNVSKLLVSH
ncbi:T9SS type A sorting domain-containing protein [Hanstruepera marina]|uniref:T9SS type A sorting domain-containing protein n=1 Tax=Hanstruepera marina TaxID=2873265 RepID=UPI001CA795BC|nr:T9SS type A sorting domain-containing protein [Hanstruepera marina]